jgi:hypothetical protein
MWTNKYQVLIETFKEFHAEVTIETSMNLNVRDHTMVANAKVTFVR